jgi:hypothetical protein
VQHPKPLPTPNEHGVFKSSIDLKKQSAVDAEKCSKASKRDESKKNFEEEKEIAEEE